MGVRWRKRRLGDSTWVQGRTPVSDTSDRRLGWSRGDRRRGTGKQISNRHTGSPNSVHNFQVKYFSKKKTIFVTQDLFSEELGDLTVRVDDRRTSRRGVGSVPSKTSCTTTVRVRFTGSPPGRPPPLRTQKSRRPLRYRHHRHPRIRGCRYKGVVSHQGVTESNRLRLLPPSFPNWLPRTPATSFTFPLCLVLSARECRRGPVGGTDETRGCRTSGVTETESLRRVLPCSYPPMRPGWVK